MVPVSLTTSRFQPRSTGVLGCILVPLDQVHEARAHGADLLMLDARLEPLVLQGLIDRVHSLGMCAVVKVRTRREALTTIESGGRIIAIDARDCDTLAVDRARFEQIAEVLPAGVTRVVAGGVRG